MPAEKLTIHLDRDSSVPMYRQLTQQFITAITEGLLRPGDPFENEVALAERLRVSRRTVRHAISQMVEQGMLQRRPGLGTVVATRRIHRRAELSSLHDDLAGDERRPTHRLLDLHRGVFPRVAAQLRLPADTELTSVTRLRLVEEQPLAILHNYLPPRCGPITVGDLEQSGLYELLRARGIRPSVARQSVGARMPTRAERRDLLIRGTQPVLTVTRIAFDAHELPVEFGDHCYRAQDFRMDFEVDHRDVER